MRIEYLNFGGALFGDEGNIEYLAKCLPTAEIVKTAPGDMPAFVNSNVDMIYIGQMTENDQLAMLEALRPHRDKLESFVNMGGVVLATGNALEIFGRYIIKEDAERIPGLSIVDIYTQRQLPLRANSLFLGKFGDDMDIVGFTSRFSHSMYVGAEPLFSVEKGCGLNGSAAGEGVRRNNFFGTYLLGPLLVLNPPFTRYLLGLLGEGSLHIEKDVTAAYEARREEYRRAIRFY